MAAISTNFDPLHNADQLGSALQHGLPRPMNARLSWSLMRTLILGGLTGGIAPVWLLPGRFSRFVESERMQYWHLAEWMRLQGAPEADAAAKSTKEMIPAFWLPLAARLFAIVAIGVGITAIRAARPSAHSDWQAWSHLLWSRVDQPQHEEGRFKHFMSVSDSEGQSYEVDASIAPDRPDPNDLILSFNLAIGGACLCWLMQINSHIARAKHFVAAFNHTSERFGVGPVHAPGWNFGIRPVWVVCGAVLASIGGYWAVPLMLAAAAQRSYVNRTTLRLRSDLARRQRDILLSRRPPVRVPASSYLLTNCPQPNCRAPLPPEATFCRRCGGRVERFNTSGKAS